MKTMPAGPYPVEVCPPECPECLKAKQRVVHMTYAENCKVCGARKLAYMARIDREKIFDAIQHVSGYAMRREAEQLVLEERARISRLAQLCPKKETAAN